MRELYKALKYDTTEKKEMDAKKILIYWKLRRKTSKVK
jgi:hypothetical protein